MPASSATLRHSFLLGYEEIKRCLVRRLGSHELASDALQETFLRLERNGDGLDPVRSPKAYLLRTALNIATNLRIAQNRRLTDLETETFLNIPDETPDAARSVEARSEIEALKRALAELPARRREIFLAVWIEETPHKAIAEHYGLSIRTIQIELKCALEHCALRLDRPLKNVAPHSRRLSVG
jgi:RNA polymerase sigma-70 factor (ECF subfamily)